MADCFSGHEIYDLILSLLPSYDSLVISFSLDINCKIVAKILWRQPNFNRLLSNLVSLEVLAMTSSIKSDKTFKNRVSNPEPIYCCLNHILSTVYCNNLTYSKIFEHFCLFVLELLAVLDKSIFCVVLFHALYSYLPFSNLGIIIVRGHLILFCYRTVFLSLRGLFLLCSFQIIPQPIH